MLTFFRLLKAIPDILNIFKHIRAMFRKLKYKWKEKKVDKAIDKAKEEKSTEDLKKEIDDLLS